MMGSEEEKLKAQSQVELLHTTNSVVMSSIRY